MDVDVHKKTCWQIKSARRMINLNPYYFAAAFGIGMLIVYISTPPPQVVLKFPSPYNAGTIEYTDKAGACYTYKAEQVPCPKDGAANIKAQPIQEDFRSRSRGCGHDGPRAAAQ